MSVGPSEIVVILLVVLLLFGSRRLADLGKGIGEAIGGFKRGLSGETEKDSVRKTESRPAQTHAAAKDPPPVAAVEERNLESASSAGSASAAGSPTSGTPTPGTPTPGTSTLGAQLESNVGPGPSPDRSPAATSAAESGGKDAGAKD